jgi:pSer/pThr/pTyr-binding forkhead associated (FHA) protein
MSLKLHLEQGDWFSNHYIGTVNEPRYNKLITSRDGIEICDSFPVTHIKVHKNVTLGRDPNTSQIVIDSIDISREHAQLYSKNDQWYVLDSNSKNGTFVVHGCISYPVFDQYKIQDSDILCLGKYTRIKVIIEP